MDGRAAVHRRRGGRLRLRPRAHGRAARRAQPRSARRPRHGADADRRARRVRPPQAHDRRSSSNADLRGASPTSSAPTPTPSRRSRRCARRSPGPVPRRGAAPRRARMPAFESNMAREQFEAMVARIIEYIYAGDAFQVVPSQRWSAPSPVEAFSIYRGLRAVNPSPYMYFLDFGDFQVAGASPEPLLTVTGRQVSHASRSRARARAARARRRTARIAARAARRREGARRARDARRPRPQRPRPRLRVRQRRTSTS